MKRILPLYAMLIGWASATLVSQPSRIELHTMTSAILGTQKDFNVFLPQDYDASTERYPVVYLFRGDAGEWVNPTQDANRRGNIKTVADTLYQSGAIGKIILVMPGLSQPATDLDLVYAVSELIPYVDQHFRTIPTRWQRGMDGFSYGGLTTIRLVLIHPEYFSSVGSYDGSIFAIDPNSYDLTNPALLANIKSMQFLIHSAAVPPNNLTVNLQFIDTLAAYGIHNVFPDIVLAPNSAHNWYFADLHMSLTLPYHWSMFLQARTNVNVQLLAPVLTGKLSGNIEVQWTLETFTPTYTTILSYSRDGGTSWNTLFKSSNHDSTFSWNTTTVPDGTRYRLRLEIAGDTSYGKVETPDNFTIDNPGNAIPDLVLLAPQAGATLAGDCQISWQAQDADDDPLSVSIDLSNDSGLSWETLVDSLANASPYVWNTRPAPNGNQARIRVRCWDGTIWTQNVTGKFSIQNIRTILAANINHVRGSGDGLVSIFVTNAAALKGHSYRMTFDDTSSGTKTYDVTDLNTGVTVVTDAGGVGSRTEGPLFDGVRLIVSDFDPPSVNSDSVRWIVGNSDLTARVVIPNLVSGSGTPYGADYEITVADHVVDTSSSFLFSTPTSLYFTVRNVTENRKATIIFNDIDNNGQIDPGDDFMILEKNGSGTQIITWDVIFNPATTYRAPVAGDVMRIRVMKPLTHNDIFEFTTNPTEAVERHGLPTSYYLAQNHPNPFNPSTTITYGLLSPGTIRLSIYDLLGRLITILFEGRQSAGDHTQVWNPGVTSGIYFARLEVFSPDGRALRFTGVRKMLLLK